MCMYIYVCDFTASIQLSPHFNFLLSGECTALTELYINNNAKFSSLPGTAGHLR